MLSVTVGLTAPPVVMAGQAIAFQASEVGGSGNGQFVLRANDASGSVLASSVEDATGHATLTVQTEDSASVFRLNPAQISPGHYNFTLGYETPSSPPVTQSLAGGIDVVTPNITVTALPSGANYTLLATPPDSSFGQGLTFYYTFYDLTAAGSVVLGTARSPTPTSMASLAVSLSPGMHHIGVKSTFPVSYGDAFVRYNILPVDLVVPRGTTTNIHSNVSIVSQNQPVANYLFNDGSGLIIDDVAGHSSGPLPVSSLTFSNDVAPPVVAGQSLDTAQGAALNAPLATTQLDNVTLSSWVKATSANGGNQSILYQGDTALNGYGLYLYQNLPAILVGGQKFLFSQIALPFNTWTLLTARRVNGIWKLAVDGTDQVLGGLDKPGAIPNLTPTTPTLGTFIGSNNTGSERFSGLINNPAIFARALDDATIRAMASELPPPPNAPLSFTSTVVGAGPDVVGFADPAGTAQLIVDGQLTGPIASIDKIGQVTLRVSSLTSGWHTIATAYSGDATHAPSQSEAISQYVRPTSLTVDGPILATFGDSITWTATTELTAQNAQTVTFVDGTTVLASHVPLDASHRAIFTTAPGLYLNAGQHTITARLEGPDFRLIESASTTILVQHRTLHVTITSPNHVYDGQTATGFSLSDDRLRSGLALSTDSPAHFFDAQVGNGKTVILTGLHLSGPDAANYILSASTFSTTANITARPVDITVTNASSRVYDGTTSVGFNFNSSLVLPGDDVRVVLSAAFASKNVGTQAVIYTSPTLAGVGSGNYAIGQVTYAAAAQTANITARSLNLSVTNATSRPYDGTTNADVTLVDDRILGDVLSVMGTASFDSSQAGVNRRVTYTVLALQGPDGGNYSVGQVTSTTADIQVLPTRTTLTLASKSDPKGQILTFQVSVSSEAAYQVAPSGMVQFYVNNEKYGAAVPLVAATTGSALISTARLDSDPLAPGRYTITAKSVGDSSPFTMSFDSIDHTVVDIAVGGGRLAIDRLNNRYLADPILNVVYKITPDGIQTVYAGSGVAGWSGDQGLATKAQLDQPTGLAVDGLGNLYISDSGNNRVRKVALDGTISTVAGNGTKVADNFSVGVASALSVSLNQPTGLALDNSGNLYIADTYNNLIRVVSADGMIRTIAGNGPGGNSSTGPIAVSAGLNKPAALATNGDGVLYFADTGNARICQVDTIVGSSPPSATPVAGGPLSNPSTSYSTVLTQINALALAQAANGTLGITFKNSSKIALLAPDTTLTYLNSTLPGYQFTSPFGMAIDIFQNFVVAERSVSNQPAPGSANLDFSTISSSTTSEPSISQFTGRAESQGFALTLSSIQSIGSGTSGGNTAGLLSFGSSALQLSTQLLTAGASALALLGTVAFTAIKTDNVPESELNPADPPVDHPGKETTPENHVPTDPWETIRKILGVDDRFQHDLESALVPPTPAANETVPAPPPPKASGPHPGANLDGPILDGGLDPTRERPALTPTGARLSSLVESALNDLEMVGWTSLGEKEIRTLSEWLNFEGREDHRNGCESWAGLVVTLVGLPTMITLSARPPRRQKSWLTHSNSSR